MQAMKARVEHTGIKPWITMVVPYRDDAALELVELVIRSAHQVPLNKLRAWLDSAGKDPREAAMKAKLR